jgi:hypothetical protein
LGSILADGVADLRIERIWRTNDDMAKANFAWRIKENLGLLCILRATP